MPTKEDLDYKKGLSGLLSKLSQIIPKASMEVFNEEGDELAKHFQNPLQLSAGMKAPDFTLNNAINQPITLSEQAKHNKIVMLFYRGQWCPYCNLILTKFEMALPLIEKRGAKFIAISPQKPDFSLTQKEKENLSFELLSDLNNIVAKAYTTVYKPSKAYLKALKEIDIDFNTYYNFVSGEIPIPSVFIIDKNMKIIMAKSEGGDYRKRNDPNEILKYL